MAILTLGNDEFASHANIELLRVMTRVVRIISLVVAPIAAVALSLSFFPPKAYLDRVRLRGHGSSIT
jgi:hypothetical protein